jgi:signal transduction histidine kinase/CheY-like chemotaxis protein
VDTKLYDNLFEGVILIEHSGKILYMNNSVITLAKVPPRVAKKIEKIDDLFEAQDFDFKDFYQGTGSGKYIVSPEITITFKESQAAYTGVFRALNLKDQGAILLCFNDLSVEVDLFDKYKEKVQVLKDSHAQLMQADKLKTLGEMTANISHELSNPLTIAVGNLEVVDMLAQQNKELTANEMFSTAMEDLKDSHARIESYIGDLKSYVYKHKEKKEYFYLIDLITNAKKLVQPRIDQGNITFNVQEYEERYVCYATKPKLEQVFVNVFQNAIDAVEDKTDPQVKVTVEVDFKEKVLKTLIEDNGSGIKAEDLENIYESFFTTKEEGKGTGLGLAISKQIISQNQGEIDVASKEGVGTTFTISLPFVEVLSVTENEELLYGTQKGKKILVIDDEVEILNLLKRYISEHYNFIGSVMPEEAFKVLEVVDVDLILVDYKLGSSTASDFVKKLREELSIDVPVYYISGSNNMQKYNEDKEAYNISGFILKPFERDSFMEILKKELGE